MEYEVVELPQMTVRGLGCRTSNTAPDMSEKIGGLWKSFFGGAFQSIDKRQAHTHTAFTAIMPRILRGNMI